VLKASSRDAQVKLALQAEILHLKKKRKVGNGLH
jgi:hypothetical protein